MTADQWMQRVQLPFRQGPSERVTEIVREVGEKVHAQAGVDSWCGWFERKAESYAALRADVERALLEVCGDQWGEHFMLPMEPEA